MRVIHYHMNRICWSTLELDYGPQYKSREEISLRETRSAKLLQEKDFQ